MINSLSIKWSHKAGYSRAWIFKKYWRNIMWNFLGLNKKQLKFSGSIKKKSQRIWFHSQEVPYNFAGFPGVELCFVQNFLGWNTKPRNSSGFFKKVCPQHPPFFWNSPIYTQQTSFWWIFAELDHPFLHLLFVMTFSYKLFPSFQTKKLWCYELYVSWLGSYSCHDNKCQVHS